MANSNFPQMHMCKRCGNIFFAAVELADRCGEHFGTPYKEEVSLSPCCHAEYVSTFACDSCGEVITGRYVSLPDDTRACDNCYVLRNIFEDD